MHILHKKQPLSVITLISEKDCLTLDIRNPLRYLLITDKLLCSLSVKILLLQVSGYVDSAGRCMGREWVTPLQSPITKRPLWQVSRFSSISTSML